MNETYYMTSKDTGYWEICTARTLTSAKRECTRRHGAGFVDDILQVGSGDSIETVATLSSKSNHPAGKWVDQ